MEIREEQHNNIIIMAVEGKLDSVTSQGLEDRILELIDTGTKKFILDFAQLDYISSAGLRVLLVAAKKLNTVAGKIVFTSMREDIKEIFNIAGLTEYYPIYRNRAEALAEMKDDDPGSNDSFEFELA